MIVAVSASFVAGAVLSWAALSFAGRGEAADQAVAHEAEKGDRDAPMLRGAVRGVPVALGIIGPYRDRCPLLYASESWATLHGHGDVEAMIGVSHWDANDITDYWKSVHLRASEGREVVVNERDTSWPGRILRWRAFPVGPDADGVFAIFADEIGQHEDLGARLRDLRVAAWGGR